MESDKNKETMETPQNQETSESKDDDVFISPALIKPISKLKTKDSSIKSNEQQKKVNEEETKDSNAIETVEPKDAFINPVFIKPIKKKNSQPLAASKCDEKDELVTAKCSTDNATSLKIKTEKCPSQRITEKETPIPYKEPPWSGLPPPEYQFEVIKNGVVLETISLNKPFFVVGRLSNCNIILEHPSISRFHCVIQYRKEGTVDYPSGLYVFDLSSTHGSFQNKCRLQPKVYNRLRVGHILKFGGSTRMFILQGPDEDQEPESKHTVTELIAIANEKKLKLQKLESGELDADSKENEDAKKKESRDSSSEGIDWGMAEDAQEENDDDDDDSEDEDPSKFKNPFATNEELYLSDPKKTLRGWFEREGHDLPEYKMEEIRPGFFRGRLELPMPGGKSIPCVVEHKGKKKDTVVQCALEACRTLDRHGLLRQATHESHEKKRKDWSENDYYDSDDDEFFDRTGDIERKRKRRRNEIESFKKTKVETYESLSKQYAEVVKVLDELEEELKKVEDLKREKEAATSDSSSFSDADELEAYMSHLSSQLPDKHKRIAWKLEVVRLRKEEVRLRKLVNIARPVGASELPDRSTKYLVAAKENPKAGREDSSKKRNTAPLRRVHEIFQEEEVEALPKLSKVDLDDDEDCLKPVPYAKQTPQNPVRRNRLRERLTSTQKYPVGGTRVKYPEGEVRLEAPLVEGARAKDASAEGARMKYPEAEVRLEAPQEIVDLENEEEQGVEEVLPTRVPSPELPQPPPVPPPQAPSLPPPETKEKEKTVSFSKPALPHGAKEKAKKKDRVPKKSPFEFEKQYEAWVPPQGQTGDGRTTLNDKLGY